MSVFKSFLLFSIFVLVFSEGAISQQQENQRAITTLSTESVSNYFGGIYYSDPLGAQLAARQLFIEGLLDKDSYLLGPNDLLSIKLEAAQNVFMRGILINPLGEITLPSIGSVSVGGLTISEAENVIEEASKSVINTAKAIITIEGLRPAIIHVTGAAPNPGKYVIPSQSRADQAIYQALTTGQRNVTSSTANSSDFLSNGNFSFRNIIIERADGTQITADLIHYFRTGDLTSNPFILDGDLITINRLNTETPKISISGAVKSDYEFEFLAGDTPLKLLNIGGGFEELADNSKLLIYRKSATGLEKIELAQDQWDTFELQPNDRVIAPFSDTENVSASAWVYGEVEIPGNFPIVSGKTTAFELLSYTEGLTENALPKASYMVRGTGLRNEIPNKFNVDLMKRTSDQVVQGLSYLDAETSLSQNKVFIDLNDEEQLKNLTLFDGDRIYIPKDEQTVFVFGQVNNPGYFPFVGNNNKSVQDYIRGAGGFALSADLDRVFIIKAGDATWYKPNQTNLESGDRIFIDRQPLEELNAKRTYEIQRQQLRNSRIQLIMTGITTITGIITTYVAVTR